MNQFVAIVLVGVVAQAMARGGAHGRRGPKSVPESCVADMEAHKTCVETEMVNAGITFDLGEVKTCLADCPKPDGAGAGSGEGGNADMEAFKECVRGIAKPQMDECMAEQIDFDVAELEGDKGFHGFKGHKGKGKGKGHKGGRRGDGGNADQALAMAQKMKEHIEACGAEACVRGIVGDAFYDQPETLVAAMTEAKDAVKAACPRTTSDQCTADREAMHDAKDACEDVAEAAKAEAETQCMTPEVEAHLAEREARRGGSEGGKGGRRGGEDGGKGGRRGARPQ